MTEDKLTKVVKIENGLLFENGYMLYSEHEQDCCEEHYLHFGDLTLEDFKDLVFNLDGDSFFERVEGYGIRLIPVNGSPVSVPGYSSNNGCYGDELTLILKTDKETKSFDITECQSDTEYDE